MATTSDAPLDYLATKPCGCVVGWLAGSIESIKGGKAEVRDFYRINTGLAIRRATTAEVRALAWKCDAHKTPKPPMVADGLFSDVKEPTDAK